MSEYLGFQKINRSAVGVTTAERTTIYQGTCDRHNVPVRESMLGMPEVAPKHSMILCFIDPQDEHQVQGERLVAVTTNLDCDSQCRGARRAFCSCGCGGINHGDHWSRDYMLANKELYQSEVERYQAEQVKLEVKREARREAKKARERRLFEEWMELHAEDVTWLAGLDIDANSPTGEPFGFVRDMAVKIHFGQILSENMLAVVIRIKGERQAKAGQLAQRDQRDAERRERGAGDQGKLVPGVYERGDKIYVVTGNQAYKSWRKQCRESGVALPRPEWAKLYAKELVESAPRMSETGEQISFELVYARGVIYDLALSDRMPLAKAEELTARYSRCIACGRHLKAAKSVQAGIGPVCIKMFGPVHQEDLESE
jgi:hypothetical protein